MRNTIFCLLLASVVFAGGCSPAFNGRWIGTGEIGEARFFSFSLRLDGKSSAGTFSFEGGEPVNGAVCRVVEQDGHVEFVLGTSGDSGSCSSLGEPLTFVGDFGRDVVTGSVLERGSDGGERLVGLFRAFRDRSKK